ncbi:sigma-54 interaction domain-containing protein [Noviherbaspirillum pedocola]|uniref:Sigma-54-dependent Fis family transcriptional regulator n=1 Tax=Noviherbaspirillum pedocola TaxID=2801341 RepID=A0A934SXR5_9BURK|nr:sigma-54 dependent transcriptional regulator [Noviherbaspirillum pedocola]MBK4734822.1 sigma-54-dependent Fis family transcriptional regulator [Noviherbaspirillum pedocola]
MSNGLNVFGNVVGMPGMEDTAISTFEKESHRAASTAHMPCDDEAARCGDIHGGSEPMRHLYRLISKVAPTRANVLISGESGTGKELVACEIHRLSREADKPFVALNCGAISPQLIEAELFGHERGSFTGAVRMHKGCFERAAGGTLFLDELTEMSMEMQVKLLRVLETGRFSRVGADDEMQVKVRVIAATNRDPQIAVDNGHLRADLFYRLSVFPIAVPTLRERGRDIELLARVFLDRHNEEEGTRKNFSKSSLRFMNEYHWPGNVRELKNMVHRAYILADNELDLAGAMGTAKPVVSGVEADCVTFPLGSRLADAEQRLIFATLGYCGGNKTQTAEMLGVSLKTLYNRLNEYQSKIFNEPALPQRQANANVNS